MSDLISRIHLYTSDYGCVVCNDACWVECIRLHFGFGDRLWSALSFTVDSHESSPTRPTNNHCYAFLLEADIHSLHRGMDALWSIHLCDLLTQHFGGQRFLPLDEGETKQQTRMDRAACFARSDHLQLSLVLDDSYQKFMGYPHRPLVHCQLCFKLAEGSEEYSVGQHVDICCRIGLCHGV